MSAGQPELNARFQRKEGGKKGKKRKRKERKEVYIQLTGLDLEHTAHAIDHVST